MIVQLIGLGYIGLPTAAVVAKHNINVIGVDINPDVVDTINRGEIHIVEQGLQNLVKETVENGLFKATTNPQQANVHIVVVPTPFKNNFEPDISFVEKATLSVIPFLKPDDLFIIESTSPIGTTENIAKLIFEKRPDLLDKLFIAYCPERVLPGNILHELIFNDRSIGGINQLSTSKAIQFYKLFVKGTLHQTNSRTAEMCKLTENASRDMQIAFANELSIICDMANINVWELIKLANLHPRVNILKPGSGVGGHCIAVDPYFIISEFPNQSRLISTAREVNNEKTEWCIKKILDTAENFRLKYGRNPIISLLGLAFKPNIDDLRESPACNIAKQIFQSEFKNILISEPNIKIHLSYKIVDFKFAIQEADIIAILVAHDEFKEIIRDNNKSYLDFVGILQ
jgi:UDP-N-acetyl-D-mannosaminuronic acid dehydrogenase